MIDGRMAQLVKRLHEKTRNKEINWESTPNYDTFVAAFPRYSVKIDQAATSKSIYVISIINDQGMVVDHIYDSELMSHFPEENWSDIMGEIYGMARRQALGADEAIAAILDELE